MKGWGPERRRGLRRRNWSRGGAGGAHGLQRRNPGMGQSSTGHQCFRAERRDLREEEEASVSIRNRGFYGTRESLPASETRGPSNQRDGLGPSAVTSRLSSLWPREKACRAQARGGGQRGEGASSRASSRRYSSRRQRALVYGELPRTSPCCTPMTRGRTRSCSL